MAGIDFEAEGLLEGTRGRAREARVELLEELADAGVPLEELRRALPSSSRKTMPKGSSVSRQWPIMRL